MGCDLVPANIKGGAVGTADEVISHGCSRASTFRSRLIVATRPHRRAPRSPILIHIRRLVLESLGRAVDDWAAALVTDGKEAGGTLGKNGRTASMNRVASLEHLAKRMQGCDA